MGKDFSMLYLPHAIIYTVEHTRDHVSCLLIVSVHWLVHM